MYIYISIMVSYYLIISSFNTIQNKIHKPFDSTKKKILSPIYQA